MASGKKAAGKSGTRGRGITRREFLKRGLKISAGLALAGLAGLPRGAWAQEIRHVAETHDRLRSFAEAVQQNYWTHSTPEQVLPLVRSRAFAKLGGTPAYSTTTADLARAMSTYPDWLVHENWAQVFGLIQDPESVKRMNAGNAGEFNPFVLSFLKRAAVLSKKVSPHSEVGWPTGKQAETEASIRLFYQQAVTVEQVRQMGEIYKQALEEYRRNDVFWDSVLAKYNWDHALVVDVMIARRLMQARDPDFVNAANAALRERQETEKWVFNPSQKGVSYQTALAKLTNGVPYTQRDMAVAGGIGLTGNQKTRLRRLMVYYRLLADRFLDSSGNIKRTAATQQEMQKTTREKIAHLDFSATRWNGLLAETNSPEERASIQGMVQLLEKRRQELAATR
jgi:hypothetical protein